jgi:hypothetical protein
MTELWTVCTLDQIFTSDVLHNLYIGIPIPEYHPKVTRSKSAAVVEYVNHLFMGGQTICMELSHFWQNWIMWDQMIKKIQIECIYQSEFLTRF